MWEKISGTIVGIILTGVLSFSVWAASSIQDLTTQVAINKVEVTNIEKKLAEIQTDLKVILGIIREQDRREYRRNK